MDIGKLQRIVVDALDDHKAEDIRVFNTTGLTGLFDRIIIATGSSNRHTRALAGHVRDRARRAGIEPIAIEGEETGEWVLVDLGDAVVHVMQPAIRAYYDLEEIWGGRPVRMRIGPAPEAASAPTSSRTAGATRASTKRAGAAQAAQAAASAGRPAGAAVRQTARAGRPAGKSTVRNRKP